MANTKNADARVRRTKKMLRAALAKLLEEKGGAADITVKALCEACGINRGTFYLHYRDVNDLLTGIEQELREGFEEELARVPIERLYAGAPAHVLDGVCRFFAQNADICRVFLCREGDSAALVERVKDVVRERALAQWKQMYAAAPHERYEYTFAFIASGCIGMLQLWLEKGMPQPPEEMAALMEAFIAKGAQALAERA